jgi:hypothetical protein
MFGTQLLAVVVGNFCANGQTVKPAPEAAHDTAFKIKNIKK